MAPGCTMVPGCTMAPGCVALQLVAGRLVPEAPPRVPTQLASPRPGAAWAAGEGSGGGSWGCYSSFAQLGQVLDWLSSKGQREAPLRAALGPLRDKVSG
jgi:hypothetical protein